jgi:hypothetical protein
VDRREFKKLLKHVNAGSLDESGLVGEIDPQAANILRNSHIVYDERTLREFLLAMSPGWRLESEERVSVVGPVSADLSSFSSVGFMGRGQVSLESVRSLESKLDQVLESVAAKPSEGNVGGRGADVPANEPLSPPDWVLSLIADVSDLLGKLDEALVLLRGLGEQGKGAGPKKK